MPHANDLHNTTNSVLSEELAPTPLVALQVMAAKALSLITLGTLRVLVTLSSDMVSSVELVMTKVSPSLKSTPSKNQEMVGAGTPVAVHISAPEAPSEKVTVGFWESEMAASGVATYVHKNRYKRKIKTRPCMKNWSGAHSPHTSSSVVMLAIPTSFTAEQV